jgi:hypothetical protein
LTKKFSAQVDDFVRQSDERMDAVFKASVQDVFNQASLARAKGGRMRVDTGFLRASGSMSLTGMPSGPSLKPKDAKKDQYGFNANLSGLAEARIGATVFVGWTANYAKFRELKDGFLETALQNWQQIVDKNVARLRARIGQ